MKYVDYGKCGFQASRFGLGCMRFERIKKDDGADVIDEGKAIELIRYAIDHGVNYLDTAYCYDGSEAVVGKVLRDGYREKVTLVTKLAVWEAHSYEDYEKLLDEQLRRLQTDCIDVYLLHGMSQDNWGNVQRYGGLKFLDEMQKKGKIKHKGFSIHSDFEHFKEVVDAYDWDMCMIQLNYVDEHHQAGVEGLKYAAQKGLPVVIMESQKGGLLSTNLPIEAQKLFDEYPVRRTPAEWAFRWLYNKPEITVILSGLNTLNQLKENLGIFENAETNVMTEDEIKLIDKVRSVFTGKIKVGCTGCKYCLPCPSGVNIPEVFKIYNDSSIFNNLDFCRMIYDLVLTSAGSNAEKCQECGRCETMCPQSIKIAGRLKEAHAVLGK